ncbi:MAG: ATP-binding protein [Chloroflexota bacterium]|nr:ATP-binding protein [Chloroflexota bacterium]
MIVSVASGKGGTGKTLVATSLALSLEGEVQLLDCDVEEPNAHIFLKPTITHREAVSVAVPEVDAAECSLCGRCAEVCAFNAIAVLPKKVMVFPELCHGCGACSYLCPENAISEVGREVGVLEMGHSGRIEFVHGKLAIGEAMAPPLIRRVKEQVKVGKTAIVDVPPGTSCPVVEAVRGCDFCLLVTEPTPFGLNDLALAVQVMRKLGIPCGVLVNRDGTGNSDVEDYCRGEGVPVLLRIPLDTEIARLYSRGITLVEGMPQWRPAFQALFEDMCAISSSELASR